MYLVIDEGHEVVGQAEESGLLDFGGRAANPSFGFAEVVFELIEDFSDVPMGFGELGDGARRKVGAKAGQIVMDDLCFRVLRDHLPYVQPPHLYRSPYRRSRFHAPAPDPIAPVTRICT